MPARSVVVSGAGTGTGRAVAARFAAAGDAVLLVGRRGDVLERPAAAMGAAAAGRRRTVAADLATPEGAQRAAAAAIGRPVHAVVHAAGGVDRAGTRTRRRSRPAGSGTCAPTS